MQANSLYRQQSERQPVLLVSILGFGADVEAKLQTVLQAARPDKPSYRLAQAHETGIHILLVNYDNPLAVQKKDLLLSERHANVQVVAFSQGPLTNPPLHHIRGLLTASRLLSVFDRIPGPDQQPKPAPAPSPQPLVIDWPTAAVTATHKEVAAPPAPRRYRALVVDDSLAIQKSLELRLLGLPQIAAVDFADNGHSALAMAAATSYQLIFLDVMMPGMDGYETCAQLRARADYKKTPIIMVSGKTSPLDEVKGIMAGCTTYITKPIQDAAFQKLGTRVLTWLTERAA